MSNKSLPHFSWSRYLAIVKKELLQIRKDPASLAIAIILPVMLLFLLGYAVNTDVEHLPMGVWDQSKTQESRQLVHNFTNTMYFDAVTQVEGDEQLQQLIDEGTVKVGLVIPADYTKKIARGESAKIQVLVDGSDPNAARTAVSNAQMVTQNRAMVLQGDVLNRHGMQQTSLPVQSEIRILYNPNMKSLMFNIPGLIGLIMQEVTLILTAFALVREKERGTMAQLIVTPVKPSELILGKITPYVGIGIFSFAIVLVTGVQWFGVPVQGSILLLTLLSLLFLVTTLAMGILISTVSKTQLQAMQLAFAIILPSVILSGFVFPRETMPQVIQWIGAVIPLTYFIEILRGIFLKGVGLDVLWRETLVLGAFTLVLCIVTIKRFRKKLE